MDDDLRIGTVATTLGVSIDTLRRWERDGRCRFERHGSRRYMSRDELARLLRERTAAAAVGPGPNRLEGVVVAVRHNGDTTRIDLACGPHQIVSLVPRAAAEALDLQPGDRATAMLRPRAIAIERAPTQAPT